MDGAQIYPIVYSKDTLFTLTNQECFYVYHSSDCVTETYMLRDDLTDKDAGTFDIVKLVRSKHLYGGYYKTYNRLGTNYDLENPKAGVVEGATKYEGGPGAWSKARAYTTNGSKMIPEANTTYFLKEVPNEVFLKMYTHVVYDTHDNNKVVKVFMITDVD